MSETAPVELRWDEPPARRHSTTFPPASTDWEAIATALRCRPGQWAIVATRANRVMAAQDAYKIRLGQLSAFSVGRFEATSRTVSGECRVYARYVGEA